MLEKVSDTAPSAVGECWNQLAMSAQAEDREGSGRYETQDGLDPTNPVKVTWESGGVPFARNPSLCLLCDLSAISVYCEKMSKGFAKS